ncbi:phosphotransferase [Thalassomonas haliotis]|uniref:Phosphotransferase n=1 Tax=Thalassomonas haliotis TaxID=485448 RepID=A0ABY7VCR8_9GAMM|nr:phosphotransferase [Thalassomonas haliotis]WDE11121.1 phosphotransferase [Thalassomonas haliotis]
MTQVSTPLFAPEVLLAQMREQRWFAQHDLESVSLEILDYLLLGNNELICEQAPGDGQVFLSASQEQLYWLKVRVGNSHYYSLVVSSCNDKLRDASQHNGFIEQLTLAGEKGLNTANGGKVCLQGKILREIITRVRPFDAGSSNSLQLCDTQTESYVLKCYRLMTESNRDEVAVTKALQGQQVMPALAGVIEYHPGQGERECLGLLTRYLPGEPVHKCFSRSIRQVMAKELGDGVAAEQEIRALKPLCRQIGGQIARFHHRLNGAYRKQLQSGKQAFDLSAYLKQSRACWQRICRAVQQDALLDISCRQKVLRQLHSCAQYLFDEAGLIGAAADLSLPVSIVHGDLHLAHVFINDESQQSCQIIDPSPISLNGEDEAFNTQVSLMDLAGFHRGLEYFSFDEVSHVMANHLAKSNSDIAALMLQQPQQLAGSCPALFSLLESWSVEIFSFLLDAYREQIKLISDSGHQLEDRIYQLFYFSRLLKELDYNYAYGRQFFKLCDLYYLNKLTDTLTS